MFKRLLTLLTTVFMMSAVAYADEINVGGKNFTEQLLLSEMTTQLLESHGLDVDKNEGMGSAVLRAAQENGQIDVYWEYTGTSLVTYNKIKERLGLDETYDRVKELDGAKGLIWLAPSKANNTYALAMRSADAKAKNITKLSDLATAYNNGQNLKMGVNAEFPKRPDGLPGLQDTYAFEAGRDNLVPMQTGLIYNAIVNGEVDTGVVFATDGRIAAFDFTVLEDDKGFFPAYALAPVVRKETLDANPEIQAWLEELSSKLDDKTMQGLNARVDVGKESIESVAADFLKSNGLM